VIRILHLSDLHCGMRARGTDLVSAFRFTTKDGKPDPERLAEILVREHQDDPPDGIIISGDVGWTGSADDYVLAERFLARLGEHWPDSQVVVAPGNHDVDRNKPDARQAAFCEFLRHLHRDAFPERYPLWSGAAGREMLVAFHTIRSRDGDSLLVVAANSAACLEAEGVPIFINPDALMAIEGQLRKLASPDPLARIFVLHHNIFPFVEVAEGDTVDLSRPERADETIVANSGKLQTWLAKHRFHVVLHGHKHVAHGREDILWHGGDPNPDSRSILTVGAGSVGVENHHRRHSEQLSYNLLTLTRRSAEQWTTHVVVRRIEESVAIPEPKNAYSYRTSLGAPLPRGPRAFHTERMDDCHRAIREACAPEELFTNFISIVEGAEYRHPDSAVIGDRLVSQHDVVSAFHVLHPECEGEHRWDDLDQVDAALERAGQPFRFQHGPRLFGHSERRNSGHPGENRWETRPILYAVKTLELDDPSKAFVSLFNPEIDVLTRDQPPPGLMSLQFIKNSPFLDLVATFRKIELSYWWVVNMYELGEILRWASDALPNNKFKPGRITFFAALAQWKREPKPAFMTALDKISLRDLSGLVLAARSPGGGAQRRKLKALVEEKARHTNDANLETERLKHLFELIEGLQGPSCDTPVSPQFRQELHTAIQEIESALRARRTVPRQESKPNIKRAAAALQRAAALIVD